MTDSLQPDLCVVGAGPAALDAAATGAALGVSVVLVLTEEFWDGDLAAGALISAGQYARERRDASRAGFPETAAALDFPAMIHHARTVAAGLAANSAHQRFTAMGITVIRGQGAFVDQRSLVAEGRTIRARRFIIAARRLPALPEVAGLADLPFLTADTVTTLERLPERLIVIGGDAEGLALAQTFRRLGSQLVIVTPASLLDGDDAEMAGVLRRALVAEGVTLRENTAVKRAERKLDGVSLLLAGPAGEETLDGSHILVACGRRAAIAPLNPVKAGIALDHDAVLIDDRLRTTNARIYSIRADSGHEAGIAVQNALLRAGKSVQQIHIPHSIRTSPEISWVGLTELQARSRHGKIEVLRWPFSENRRARAEGAANGFVKILATRKGVVLGAAIAGPRAGELIAPWTVAISRRMTVEEMSQLAMPPFSLSEATRHAALGYFGRRLTGLSLAMALKFNRWLG